jgi:hypothetical protein
LKRRRSSRMGETESEEEADLIYVRLLLSPGAAEKQIEAVAKRARLVDSVKLHQKVH